MNIRIFAAALATMAPLPAFAQGIAEHEHFFDGHGMGFGAMMLAGPIFMLGLIAVVAVIIFQVLRHSGHGGNGERGGRATPRDILNERFARGEIERDEFEDRRRALGE